MSLPDDVLALLEELAQRPDLDEMTRGSIRHALIEHGEDREFIPGDLAYWSDEGLIWDSTPDGSQTGWWSAREQKFVDPPPVELDVLVHGNMLIAEAADPEAKAKLDAAYTLFNAVQWGMTQYVLCTQTNPEPGSKAMRRLVPAGMSTVNELITAYETARAAFQE